ncbi:cell surface glycoprotein CD200 receptor 1 isoform X2 [Lepisosteus oculatus]|uniref:cell surface glycoprotein CD200 receptor 1 isoform X2 n=1 Tax=Lepisosteus oculatus TaxID=7918 RepID=UPI0035F507FF
MTENWIVKVIFFLTFYASLSLAINEHRSEIVELDRSVDLMCTNQTWNNTIFVVWKKKKGGKEECNIAKRTIEPEVNSCNDGKRIQNRQNGTFLHIPHFQYKDEGIYYCEVVYQGGLHASQINVSARVPPKINLVYDITQKMATCTAANSKPAANISWIGVSNWTEKTTKNPDHTYTVESSASIPDNTSLQNVSCVVEHPVWKEGVHKTVGLPLENFPSFPLTWTIISVSLSGFVVLILVASFFIRKHLSKIRNCCKSSIPAPPPANRKQDVEELEPYASYVERVNSIYNSSAELCNA